MPSLAYQAVLLDAGGVFHLPDPERIIAVATDAGFTIDRSRIDEAHYAGAATVSGREGDDPHAFWTGYLLHYVETLGVPPEHIEAALEGFAAAFTAGGLWRRVIPGSVDALREIAATGVRLAIVSNANGTVEARLRDEGICQVGPGAGVPVEVVIDSAVVGVEKPDPRIFEITLEHLGLSPEDVIHVGDTPAADGDGARAAGIRPILLDPYGFLEGVDPATRIPHLRDVVGIVNPAHT